jgi:3-dehydroquinate synthase
MDSSLTTLRVQSSAGEYPVLIGLGLLGKSGLAIREQPFAKGARRCAIVTDSHVGPLYAEAALGSLREAGFEPALVTVPAGEASKSLGEAGRVADALISAGLDRQGFLVALGGGVIGDLAGFVASIYYRGIPFVQIPTTVVAQVDSAIGGKTGVNSSLGKNLLGSFHPPALVIADTLTLNTLPARDFNEGFGEIIKHGVIRDRALLEMLETFQRGDSAAMAGIVHRNLAIKAALVAGDEFETKGERALLNFGHTIGHGIEQAAGYGRFLHGEAVSLGMIAAGRLSMEKAGLPEADFRYLVSRLRQFGLPTQLPADIGAADILASLGRDKKFTGGKIRFVLTPGLGSAFLTAPGDIGAADLERAIDRLREPV